MARPTRDERKAELLAAILDYLMDKTLAELTFRSLAEGLGMSAYVLVYHFGTRDQLINDIVVSIESRLDRMPAEWWLRRSQQHAVEARRFAVRTRTFHPARTR